MEDYAKTIQDFGDICTSCDYEIRNKGFLHLSRRADEGIRKKPDHFMLPDGTIVNKMPKRTN